MTDSLITPFPSFSFHQHQVEAIAWMMGREAAGAMHVRGGILADEMGLGKTVQVIAFLAHLYAMRVSGPYLIVGPLSTLGNWMAELGRFAPDMLVVCERFRLIEVLTKAKETAQ